MTARSVKDRRLVAHTAQIRPAWFSAQVLTATLQIFLQLSAMCQAEIQVRKCPNCSETDATPLPCYSRGEWMIVQCNRCVFVFLANPVSYQALMDAHEWQSSFAREKKRRQEHARLSRIIRRLRYHFRHLRTDRKRLFLQLFGAGKVVDVGCGLGNMLPEPIVPIGIEISPKLARQADRNMRARGGYCLHATALEGMRQLSSNAFDGILLNSFLEHEIAPLKLLKESRRVLKSDGKIYVRVPNYGSINRKLLGKRWCGFRYPDHVNYFCWHSLSNMAEKAGFQARLLNSWNLPLDDNIKAVLQPC